jgi:hypothetical protein
VVSSIADNGDATTAARANYIGYAFNAALILYPFLSRASVAIFKCRDVDGTLYLEADYTIQCENTDWYLVAVGSSVICVVYVLGLPVFVARDVWRGSNAIRFYAEGYRTDRGRLALGWEVLEMLRKFILTSAVLFLHQGSVAQVAVALVVSVCFLVFHVRVLPFASNADNWLQGFALVGLCIVYFVGLIIKALPESDIGSYFDSLLQLSSTAIFFVAFAIPLCLKAKFWYRGIVGKSRANTEMLEPLMFDGGNGGIEVHSLQFREELHILRQEHESMQERCQHEKEELLEERKQEQEERKREQEERKREQAEHIATLDRFQRAVEERATMQDELGRERDARAAMQEEHAIERAAMQEYLRRLVHDQKADAGPGAAAAVVATVPGRRFFDTQQSATGKAPSAPRNGHSSSVR